MERRRFLAGVGAATSISFAGCSNDEAENTDTLADSDGDGVPDTHDYAPNDPDIQSRSDAVTATREPPQSTPTSTSTPTPEPTNSGISSNVTADTTIQADSRQLDGVMHHLVEYSRSHARVKIYGDLLDNSYPRGAELVSIVQGYPDSVSSDRVHAESRSSTFNPPSSGEKTVTIHFDTPVKTGSPFYYWMILVPTGTDLSSRDGSNSDFLCETDRLTITNNELTRSRHPSEPGDDINNRFTRYSAEGCYMFEFSGTSHRRNWNANFTIFKHGYIEDINDTRYTDRRQYIYEALNSGLADELGNILNNAAEQNGITGDAQKVAFLLNFVQNLPYIPDDVSTGYDDYTKRHIETLVDGGGDCEDSAVMLASLLSSEPFGYGTALILPPGHAAVGIKGSNDIEGTYYEKEGTRYYYIETTGQGWEIGEVPDEYKNGTAYVRVV